MTEREDIPAFDLILVDEGQDFSHRMFEVLVRLVEPGGELTVVCDPAQDIYLRWRTSNLAPLGAYETEHLVDCYRNTAPIFAAALGVMDPATRKDMGLSRLEMTRPEDLGRVGPPPEFPRFSSLDDLLSLVKTKVAEFREAGRPLSELAVLYPDRRAVPGLPARLAASSWACRTDPRYRGLEEDEDGPASATMEGTLAPADAEPALTTLPRPHFAEALERELSDAGIPAEWVARDFLTKSRYDIAKDRLTLCTIHSAKGMDFHTVILLGAETLPEEDAERAVRSSALLFTGITRAREALLIPFFAETGWIPKLIAGP
jgi:superfamily I DNA/RNA helicase